MIHRFLSVSALLTLLVGLTTTHAALVTTHTDADHTDGATVDGTISSGEYNTYTYTGGGSGFGGGLGGGTLYMESDATNLYLGFAPGGSFAPNLVTFFLDTQSGGFGDDTGMTDTADAGRHIVSDLTRDSQDNFPIEADFALQFGDGFINLFRLTGSSHTFIAPTTATDTAREVSIPLATLGLVGGDAVDFFGTLISETRFTSDEGIPDTGFGSNPGFGSPGGTVDWADHHRFIVAVPEASSLLAMSLLYGVGFGFRGRRR